jgi:hypothetical protein
MGAPQCARGIVGRRPSSDARAEIDARRGCMALKCSPCGSGARGQRSGSRGCSALVDQRLQLNKMRAAEILLARLMAAAELGGGGPPALPASLCPLRSSGMSRVISNGASGQ